MPIIELDESYKSLENEFIELSQQDNDAYDDDDNEKNKSALPQLDTFRENEDNDGDVIDVTIDGPLSHTTGQTETTSDEYFNQPEEEGDDTEATKTMASLGKWWKENCPDEHHHLTKREFASMGSKVMAFLHILIQAVSRHDKVLLFSQVDRIPTIFYQSFRISQLWTFSK